jgi:membrane fusion protein, heavy metal efflux system
MKQTIFTNRGHSSLKLIPYILTILFVCSNANLVIAADHDHEAHDQHEAGQGTHEEHGGHDEHEAVELKFSTAELQEFSIELAQAGPGVINKTLDLTGEVIVEPGRLYHVVPRVSGVVRHVFKHLGDTVKADDLLATLSSRDLADAKAQFVAADSLRKLANANLQRERKLYQEKITAKREYLEARQAQAEMSVRRKAAKQRLLALGLTKQSIASVLQDAEKDLTYYELRAPAAGIIIEKHAVHGEVLETNTRSFTIADLSKVWVNLTVYQKDLPFIHQGQQVLISSRFGLTDHEVTASSTISWLSPTLNEKTRSATARVIIDNSENHWRPGLFVSGKVAIEKKQAEIVIPLTALQTVEGQTIVFIQHEDGGFEPQPVQTGRRDFQQVEIIQGLKPGQTYVSQNAFSLKAQLQKSEFGEGHSH